MSSLHAANSVCLNFMKGLKTFPCFNILRPLGLRTTQTEHPPSRLNALYQSSDVTTHLPVRSLRHDVAMNFIHDCKNLRSHGNLAIILPAECNRPALNYLKNTKAREMPQTFSYCYERKGFFFLLSQTSVSNALYCRRWRRKQILNFPVSLSLRAQYADADSLL